MAGLLGGDYQPDPVAQGLLGLGAALMTPRLLGGGIGPGLMAFNQQAMAAQQAQRQMSLDALRTQLMQAQIGETTAQAEERKATAEERRRQTAALLAQQQAQANILGDIVSRTSPQPSGFRDASVALSAAQGVPPPTGYTPPQQRSAGPVLTQSDVARWISAGGDPAKLKQIVESGDWGRPEVARVLEARGPDNMPQQQQYDKFGNVVGPAVPKPVEMRMQDIGGSVVPVNPFNPTALTKTMAPGEVASNQVALGNLGVARERLAMDREQASAGKWQYDAERGGRVNTQTGEFQPVTQGGVPIGAKQQPMPEGARKQVAGVRGLQDAIRNYQDALRNWSATDAIKPDRRAEMGTVYNNVLLQAKEAYNLGVLNGPDYMILQQVLTNPMSITGSITSNVALSKQAEELSRIMKAIEQTVVSTNSRDQAAAPATIPAITGPGSIQDLARQELARRAGGK